MTNEEAINVLKNTAWLGTEKDREEVKKALETLSNTSEIPNSSDDLINRQDAIAAIIGLPTWYYDSDRHYGDPQPPMEALLDPEDVVNAIEILPHAKPTLYGYNIEHLELIARVLQKEDLLPERVVEALTDIGRIVAIVNEEFEEALKKAVEQCTI